MKYAIIRSGGKQYKAVPGERIQVDKLPVDPGKKVVLNEVLFIADGVKKVTIGTPLIKGAKVETTVADQIKGPKIRVFKYKPKVRYRRRQGHRQQYTLLNVDKIVSSSAKSTTKTSEKASPKTSAKASTSTKASTKTTKKASSKPATKSSSKPAAKTSSKPAAKTSSKTASKTKAKASTKKAGDKDGS